MKNRKIIVLSEVEPSWVCDAKVGESERVRSGSAVACFVCLCFTALLQICTRPIAPAFRSLSGQSMALTCVSFDLWHSVVLAQHGLVLSRDRRAEDTGWSTLSVSVCVNTIKYSPGVTKYRTHIVLYLQASPLPPTSGWDRGFDVWMLGCLDAWSFRI